jgi:hypothetical protein
VSRPAIITKEQDKEIIRLRKSGMKLQDIADKYNVTAACISSRLNRYGMHSKCENDRNDAMVIRSKKVQNYIDNIINNLKTGQIINLKYRIESGRRDNPELFGRMLKLTSGVVKEKYKDFFVIESRKDPHIRQAVSRGELISRDVEVV